MDQQEKDWLRLGQDLYDYQPQGDPVGDFAKFQELQRSTSGKTRLAPLGQLLLGLGLMMIGAIWLFQDSHSLAVGTAFPMPTSEHEADELSVAQPAEDNEHTWPHPNSDKLETILGNTTGLAETTRASLSATGNINPANEVMQVAPTSIPGKPYDEYSGTSSNPAHLKREQVVAAAPPALVEHSRDKAAFGIARLAVVQQSVSVKNALPSVSLSVVKEEAVISPSQALPKLSFGGGLSSHWRGDQFLSDTDLGVYMSLGIQKPISERLSVAGRVGYRGHNLNLQVFEDEKPWSHYEEKTNEIDDNGEEIEYTYVGVVDGYKGIEFSVLLQYELNHRTSLQAGGRYSLPSLAFRRTVHSSRDGDVTAQPNPYHFFATQQPLVKYYDYGALLGGQYRINNSLSFEAELHLGMVDLIEDAGERRERFNHSSSVSLGLRYRLN